MRARLARLPEGRAGSAICGSGAHAAVDGRVTSHGTPRGLTCASDVAPGARPTLTMADLKAAFMRTPWSKPQVSSQPAGNTTLVNLTTFYKVNWAVEGFQPGEVDRSVLRGIPGADPPQARRVHLRVRRRLDRGSHDVDRRRLPQRRHHRTSTARRASTPSASTRPSGPTSAWTAPRGTRSPRPSPCRDRRRPSRFVRPRACSSTTEQLPRRRGPKVTAPSGSRCAARPAHRRPPPRRGPRRRPGPRSVSHPPRAARSSHRAHGPAPGPLRACGRT